MRTVSDLLALAGAKLTAQAPDVAGDPAGVEQPAAAAKTTFADVGARIGEDNQVLRNLLIDTGNQLSTIDDLKESFSKLVEPLSNVLTTLEQERANNASSQGALAAMRSSQDALRTQFQSLEKKSSRLESENERLARELTTAQTSVRELDDEKVKLTAQTEAGRSAMAMIVKQLGEESGNVRILSEQKKLLSDRTDASAKRITELESEFAHARERLSLVENDRETVQAALDKTLAEASRLSRRLAQSESALTDTRNRIQQLEGNLSTAEGERNKLAAACDEANERRQSDVYALELKLDAMRSHSEAAEKLLAGARVNLQSRAEEIRATEERLADATAARGKADAKAEQLAGDNEKLELQRRKLELDGVSLTERCKVLSDTLVSSENAMTHAKDKIKSLTSQLEQIQLDSSANRTKAEEDFVQLNATVEHERCERALAEGALETIRNDYARIQREMAQERSLRRVDHQRRTVRNPRTLP